MEEKKEKSTSRFLHSIDKYAKRQRLKIAEEIRKFEEKRLKVEEQKIVENARTLMMSELANVKTEVFMKVSNAKTVSVQKIYQRKFEIQKKIFEKCESKIIEFTKSDNYNERLKKSIDFALKYLGTPLSVFSREQDLKKINCLCDISNCKISTSNKIKYGGLLFCKNGIVLDDTFDASISREKKSFFERYFSSLV